MKIIRQVDAVLARIEKGAILFCFGLLVCLVIFDILSRNFLHLPSHRIFEVGPRLVLWLALFGASLALKQKRHIRLELALRHFSDRMRFWATVVSHIFGAVVMGLLLFASLEFVENEVAMFGGWGWLAVIFPVFFGLATVRFLTGLLDGPDSAPSVETDRRNSSLR